MKFRYVLPALILVLFLVAACSPPPELRNDAFLQDTSLIDGEPCGPPCWRDIVPGETDWNEARTILEDDTTLSDVRVEDDDETEEIAATFQQEGGVPCCLVYSETGETADQMLLQLAPDMTLEEVFEVLGEPTYFTGAEVSPEQAAASLYYPDQNTIVYAFVDGVDGNIDEDSEVFATLYVRQEDMEQVLLNSPLYDWDGFGTFRSYIDTEPDITPVPTEEPEE